MGKYTMFKKNILLLFVFLGVSCAQEHKGALLSPSPLWARFEWFSYAGNDDVFNLPLKDGYYRNPILAGYYPDPSIVRVGEDFYLIHSTFGFFPGIPVFHSRDLVNWTQIGNAIHRPEQLSFDGIHLGYNGVYAPAIEYKDGRFYIINTCIGCGGNFVVTASDPAGPWSDPIWLPHLEGIDPSIFFDTDGKVYVVHHKDPAVKKNDAHTALWVMEVDSKTFQPLSKDIMLVDGGEKAPWNTDYIEGPHLYKVNGQYFLSAPGGGTGYFHSQLIYKADNVYGPYKANPNNPILTQFGLPDDRKYPVTATGHADLVEDTNGNWWAVFLGTRVFDLKEGNQNPGSFNTGRETFLLPVTWDEGWPIILEKHKVLPLQVKMPDLPLSASEEPLTGNFRVKEYFTGATLGLSWLFIRTPTTKWWRTGGSNLEMQARSEYIGQYNQPSFIGRRLAHMNATFGTKMFFQPNTQKAEAGLLAIQNDEYYYAFGLGMNANGETVLRVRRKSGKGSPYSGVVIAERVVVDASMPVYLQIELDQSVIHFQYSYDGEHYQNLLNGADARILSSAVSGGFTGAVIGMYAEVDEI